VLLNATTPPASSAPAKRQNGNARSVKKDVSPKRPRKAKDEIRAEYRFDYARVRSNRFADRTKNGAAAVILAPDVAAVFGSSKAVNEFLRSVITMLSVRVHKRAKAG
jgi:Tfp pilus assembly protein PilF